MEGTQEIRNLQMLAFRTQTPEIQSPEDWPAGDDGGRTSHVKSLRKAEQHNKEHGEVQDGGLSKVTTTDTQSYPGGTKLTR